MFPAYGTLIQGIAFAIWVSLVFQRFSDWRKMKHSEELVTKYEIERILES